MRLALNAETGASACANMRAAGIALYSSLEQLDAALNNPIKE